MTTLQSQISRIFADSGETFFSGEELSRILGVSRTAVWKQIGGMRRAGYQIEAVPSKGYRLLSVPEMMSAESIAAELRSDRFGATIIYNSETESTNSDAAAAAENGAAEGTVIVADCQNSGKGRLGRVWLSPPGVNLYCSIILRPKIPAYQAPQLTFLSAVAVARSITELTGLTPAIKWPNDILINNRKVAGLLNEMNAETDSVNFVILGIGVNLNMRVEQFSSELRTPATSLFIESGKTVNRSLFTASLLNHFENLYNEFKTGGFEPVREAWLSACNSSGRILEVSDGIFDSGSLSGKFAGIDESGALLLTMADGSTKTIYSGDVRIL